MNELMLARVKRDTPELNPDIANGLVSKFNVDVPAYIDRVWRTVAKDFPAGLQYDGYEKCTPYQEYSYITSKTTAVRKIVETARNDIYLVKYNFSYKGVKLPPRPVYLPIIGEAGSIVLSGSTFFIAPILADIVLSFEQTGVFVRLLRAKFPLNRVTHSVVVDGRVLPQSVVHASLYNHSAKNKPTDKVNKAHSCIMHYLLAKYGFSETFRRFTGTIPAVSDQPFSTAEYPQEDWVIVHSFGHRPASVNAKPMYVPSTIHVAVKRSEYTSTVQTMLASFFYIVDHFPTRIKAGQIDEDWHWKVTLGQLIFGATPSYGKLESDVKEHMDSLQEYVDEIVKARFKLRGMNVGDIYELFAQAMANYNDWILAAKTKSNSLYDKELSVLLDVFMPLTSQIMNVYFKLKSASRKTLTEKEIDNIFRRVLKARTIFSLNNRHAGVSSLGYSGDNKCMKITSVVVPQRNASKTNNKTTNLNDPSRRLHVSFAEVGGYLHLSDSNIAGDGRVNPHLKLTEKNLIVRSDDTKALLDKVQAMIQRD